MTKNNNCKEVEKSQLVRVIDVLFIGPVIIYAATQIKNNWLKIILLIIGIGTIIYNAKNYIETKKANSSVI